MPHKRLRVVGLALEGQRGQRWLLQNTLVTRCMLADEKERKYAWHLERLLAHPCRIVIRNCLHPRERPSMRRGPRCRVE